jgi:hypothetical protein
VEKKLAESLHNCLNGRKIAIWGIGPNTVNLLGKILQFCDVDCYISKDAKPGDMFCGRPVTPPPPEISRNYQANALYHRFSGGYLSRDTQTVG